MMIVLYFLGENKMPQLNVDWYEILTYRKTKYVIYGFGQPSTHIMDWSGCNFHHGRLNGYAYKISDKKYVQIESPVFESIDDALDWLVQFNKEYNGVEISGHFAGDFGCSQCKKRIIEERYEYKGKSIELTAIQTFVLNSL
jgi:hypothetical protein